MILTYQEVISNKHSEGSETFRVVLDKGGSFVFFATSLGSLGGRM